MHTHFSMLGFELPPFCLSSMQQHRISLYIAATYQSIYRSIVSVYILMYADRLFQEKLFIIQLK